MASEGTPGSTFGFGPLDPLPEQGEPSGIFDEPEQAPAPATPKEPEAAPATAPAEPETPAPWAPQEEEAPPEEETPSEPELFLGRYPTKEAAEQGYKELQREFTQRSTEIAELRQKAEEHEQLMVLMAPLIQERLVQERPELAEELEFAERINPLIEERLAPIREQEQARQQQAEFEATVGAFRQRHPEIPPGSPADAQLREVTDNLDLDREDPYMLEAAAEAVADPALYHVLRASPHLVETEEGMQQARYTAQQFAQYQQQSAPTPPAQGTPQGGPVQRRARVPFVEHGGSGAPTEGAPGTQPDNPLKEAIALYNQERQSPLLR